MKTINIILTQEIKSQCVNWSAPTGKRIDDRLPLAKVFGLDWETVGDRSFPRPTEIELNTTADALDERIRDIAKGNKVRVIRTGTVSWKASMNIRPARETFPFPEVSGDGTKWGAADFYDDTRAHILAAVRSGLNFDTDWLACKKEPVSTRIERTGNRTSVTVSVFGEEEAYGSATVTTQLHKHLTEEQIFSRIEKAAYRANDIAEKDLAGWEAEFAE